MSACQDFIQICISEEYNCFLLLFVFLIKKISGLCFLFISRTSNFACIKNVKSSTQFSLALLLDSLILDQ